jgi:lipoprotein-anchoring transpeptidase ErfK/SrfK
MSGGQHARVPARGERARGIVRSLGLGGGLLALGVLSAGAGVVVATHSPLTVNLLGSSAAAQTAPAVAPEPTPVTEPEPEPEPTIEYHDYDYSLPADMSAVSPTSVYPTGTAERYGVGVVIRIQFGAAVPEEMKVLLQRTATVTASQPIGLAAWSWPNDTTMIYRPREFWPSRTTVNLTTTWVENGLSTLAPDREFRIGREQILNIRQQSQLGVLTREGEFLRVIPVSLGKSTWETLSGVKTIMERYRVKRMVNPGPREPYDVQVPYALRITPSGEYLHAAPWNLYNIGRSPTSHGCTNMTMEDGQWFYENALEGDPVITTGTGVAVDWFEGPGASWNIDWADWMAASPALP